MMMRRLIALLCTSVYLLAAGGTALLSLSCPCVDSARTHHSCCHTQAAHVHGSCCHTAVDRAIGDAAFRAVCCDTVHSNKQQLYTANEENSERRAGRVSVLSAVEPLTGCTLLSEPPCCEHGRLLPRRTPPLLAGEVSSCTLRAPPVTV